ncbi:MAG: DUF3298 and DUF4163 domain-containing protein [Candidatus Paceibacterota bacterium]
MNKKIASMVGMILAAFCLGILVTVSWRGAWLMPNASRNASSSLPISIVSLHDTSSKLWALNVEYPQFSFAPAAFNKEISDAVNGQLADFKKNAQDNWQARQATTPSGTPVEQFPSSPFDFMVTWESAQINDHYISIVVRFSSYEGGAHGLEELQTFNWDLPLRHDVALADLYPTTVDYLAKISQLSREQLAGSLESASGGNVQTDMLDAGTTPTVDNFKNFTFTNYLVTIYFPKYQVAPGAFGEQRITLPLGTL